MSYSKTVDQKWQKKWKEQGLNKFKLDENGNKLYCLEMFSYPSGANLHLGHWYNYAPADSYARLKRMKGFNVFHPMGFDAFGLPAENYAIKTGIHPQDSTIKNIETMKRQLEEMGADYDWDYSVETCMPDYYRWTQWIFLQLYKAGLAYKKEAPVNWCNSCNTVLANEQVVGGVCERCGTQVEKKKLRQWFFRTTKYAQELLDGLEDLDWPELTKKIQKNWIGRSEGSHIIFKSEDTDIEFKVFTTRPDTVYGVTYVVMAPESSLVDKICKEEYRADIEEYRQRTSKLTEIERMSEEREKTGVFTGAYVINPVNNEKVPVWISDYVIEDYGTGMVMAVPAHDDRDYAFATKYNLPIKQVVASKDGKEVKLPYTEKGILINSDKFNEMTSEKAKTEITDYLNSLGCGEKTINYRLKDWLISRQRYWGAPIPIIYCPNCGEVAVDEKDLPVRLPYNVEFKPDGESPLKKSEEFMNCTCPKCGAKATREADTLDTFVCSSWYYLRYPDANNDKEAFNKEIINKMLPVDVYIGGKEHAAMHLIYARFMTKALRDLGYLNFDEPFKRLVHQGTILGKDGNKMSKSKGNTVSPDVYIDEYGADVFRLYLMFGFDYVKGGPWSDDGIKSIAKYLKRIETLIQKICSTKYEKKESLDKEEKELLFVENKTIKSMEEDIERFQFNTAVARAMEFLNALVKYEQSNEPKNMKIFNAAIETYIKLLAPLAPHFAEEEWESLGKETSVHKEKWPKFDEKAIQKKSVEIPVQINGKVKFKVEIDVASSKEDVEKIVKTSEGFKAFRECTIKNEVYVPGRIYSIQII